MHFGGPPESEMEVLDALREALLEDGECRSMRM